MVSLKSKFGIVFSIILSVLFLMFLYQRSQSEQTRGQDVTSKSYVYEDEVDLRIIVITYNRDQSLMKLLRTIDELELDGDKAALEIWIDVNKEGRFHNKTVSSAKSFQWKKGPCRVHIQPQHAGIYGQWIDTWRPRDPNSKELALILEDDISLSKYAYRWIRAVHRAYGSRPDFAGSSLTSDEQKSHDGTFRVLHRPKNETVFMYKCIGTWGFSPRTAMWADFQDWFHEHVDKKGFHPYVPNIVTTQWYKEFEAAGNEDSMWEQWFIYYAYKEKLFTVYNNLKNVNGDDRSCLCINRREVGLHVDSKGPEDYCSLLTRWKDDFVSFPNRITRLDWNGNAIEKY